MTGGEHLKKAAIATIRKASKRLDDMIGFAAPEIWETHVREAQEDLVEAIETLEDNEEENQDE